MRIFGGERVQGLMDTLGLDEDMPIENKLITNTIESAQKKLEAPTLPSVSRCCSMTMS